MGNKLNKQEPHKPELQTKEPEKSTFQRLLARFQIRPKKPENVSSKQSNGKSKYHSPPPKPPLRNHTERVLSKSVVPEEASKPSEWTEITLQSPESPPKSNQSYNIKITPVPPPRKHKVKLQEILDTPKISINLEGKSDNFQENRLPVEEPIIVKQKVVEHVCDGTHRHVKNTVNGKVVDEIIPLTLKELKQSKSAKTASTLSLPSYNNLKRKDEKSAPSPIKSTKKNSSASSLPTDKKSKSRHTAAEKIESYMIRCRSFGSIIPHAKTEKRKEPEKYSDKESIDSWSGLEDWDLGIIENDVSSEPPQTLWNNGIKHKGDEATQSEKSPQKDSAKISKMNSAKPETKKCDGLVSEIYATFLKNSLIQNTVQNEVTMLPDISQKVKSSSSSPPHEQYMNKHNPLKINYENDTFFTKYFLENERIYNNRCTGLTYHKKQAPLAAFDSDKESEKDGNTENSIDELDCTVSVETKETTSPIEKIIVVTKESIPPTLEKSAPKLTPRRKSSSGHSKLLKYIKDAKEHEVQIVDNSNTHIINKTVALEKIEDPEIVPMLKQIDTSWSNLIQRYDINNVKILEQESSISDLVDSSSDDTRSTTIESSYHK